MLNVSATSDSAATHVGQTGEGLEVGNGRYVDDFYNPQHDISGRVRAHMSGSHQNVNFSGGPDEGALSLTLR